MPFSIGKYGRSFRSLLILVVYTSFFLVHFSCINGPDSVTVISTLSFHKTKQNTIDNQQDDVKKTKLTINKRFQHTGADILLPSFIDIPVYTGCIVHAVKPANYHFISFILATSLRGPPSAS